MVQLSNIHYQVMCRNPTLAKCGGEAQHFQSWGFGVFRDPEYLEFDSKA
jgi:hypothetical protein